MNKRNLIPIVTLCVIAVCAAFGLYRTSPKNCISYGAAESISADEDADARANYEWMQLRDPATGKIPAHIREKELAFAATLPGNTGMGAFGKTTTATLAFAQRGPWNVGGRTRAFGIDVSNENNLLAGTVSGGMWRSTNGGASWVITTPINAYMNVSCITQDKRPGHTNVWYYGSGEASGASASGNGAYYLGNGVFKSTDSGVTWNVLTATTSAMLSGFDVWGDLIWNIVADSSNAAQDIVYAAAYGCIQRSTDGGTTWTLVNGTFGTASDCYYTDVAVSKTGIVYATISSDGPSRGIYRSTDGVTFINITPSSFPTVYNRIKIGISPSDENQIYLLGNTPGYGQPDTNYLGTVEWNSLWKYNYISGDGSGTGGAWQDRSYSLPNSGGMFDKFQTQGSYDIVIKVKPNDTNTVFIGGTNLYYSTNGFADSMHTHYIGGYQQGATLPIVVGYANHHPDQHELVFYPSNPNKMISTNDGGIFKTNDNTASPLVWSSLNNGYLSSMFYTCAIDHAATNDIIIGGAQDNGSWYTNNTTLTTPWVTPRGGDGSYCAIADNGSAYYFSIQQGKIMKAKVNASGGIDSFARIDPIGGHGYQFINPFVLDPNDNNLMYMVAGTNLWRNNNLSGIPYISNWDSISTNWVRYPDSLYTGLSYTAVAVSTVPANRVYIGTSNRKLYRIDNANTGTPAKTDITSTTSVNLFPAGGSISCIAVDPTNADHILVTFSNYNIYSLYYSANGGTTWVKVGGNLEPNINGTGNGPSLRWAKIIPLAEGTVYLVGTSVGLYATTLLDSVNTVWTQQGSTSIGSSVVDMIDYRATDGLVVIATHAHGMFSTHITLVTDVDMVQPVTHTISYGLDNFPNPFTNQTNIRFNLPEAAHISLTVYDASGRVVSTVANESMSAGQHSYPFTNNNLSPGIYFCTLKTKNQNPQTHMMMVN